MVVALLFPALAVAQQPTDTSQVPEATKRTRPYQRAEWFWSQRAYPQGYIPSGVREDALRQLDQMIADEAQTTPKLSGARGLSLANGSAVPASGVVWSPMGPQPTASDVVSFKEFPTSGRLTSIVVDPLTPTTIYLGAAQGGVWKSTDGGANWTPLTDDQPSLAVGAIALDPDNNQSIWVGTGEENFGGDNYYGAGILKSANGGATWTQLGQSTFSGAINSIPPTIGGAKIGSLAILKGSSGQIAIAAVQFFQQSGFTPHSGIYRTADGGVTWTNVLNAAAGNVVAWDPNNASNCGSACIGYATIGNPFSDSTNGFYRSTDSGQTWTKMDGGGVVPNANAGRIAMGLAKNSSTNTIKTTIYLGIGNSSTNNLLGMYKSTDGGTTWVALSNPPNYCPTQCFYDNVIGVVPNNDSVVFAGGAFTDNVGNNSRMWRSADGGATWAEISQPTGFSFPALHADLHAIAFSPDNVTVYAGNDGGIYSSANAPNSATASANITWSNLNGSATDVTKSLAITQFYPGMAITGANYVFGGTQDNGSQLFTGNVVWNEIACGDGGWSAIDPTNANTLYTACNNIDVEKSTGTPTWGSFTAATNGITTNDRSNFIPPLVMDPSNAQTLYFGSFKLYQTTNGAGTWTAMAGAADLTGGGNAHINAIGVGPNNTVWVGTSGSGSTVNSKVQVSANANLGASATFTDRSTGLPTRAVTQVKPDFADATGATAYVTFSGFDQFAAGGGDGLGYVYKTTNSGANWTNITGNLPHSPTNDIVVDPTIPNTLYVGNDIGVFYTSNGGTTWSTLVDGLPRVSVLSLKLHAASRTLVAGTHGRSAWRVVVGAVVGVVPTNLPFGQRGFGSASAPQSVTVSNTGSTAVTLTSFSISLNSTEFAIAAPAATKRSNRIPTCSNGMVLGSGATCVISVTFTPAATGARTGTLTINNNGAVPVLSVALTGSGPAANAVSFLPNPVNFGNLILNGYSTIPVTLSNSTAGPIVVSSFTLPGGYSQTNNCSGPLNPSSGCTVLVTFHPTSLTTFSGTLSAFDSGVGSPHTASVSGTGFDPTLTTIRPNTVAGTPTTTPTTITPSRPSLPVRSAANLVIAGRAAFVPIVFSPGSAAGTASLSCFGAPDGTTCDVQPSVLQLRGIPARANVVVRYTDSADAAAPGLYQVQVVASTDSFASILPIPIELASSSAASGVPALPRLAEPAPQPKSSSTAADSAPPALHSSDEPSAPAFELSATRIEFGAEDQKTDAAAHEITLTNLQSTPLSLSIDSITGDFVQSNDCGSELAVAANCRIAIRLKPSASALSSGKLTVTTAAGTATVELVATVR